MIVSAYRSAAEVPAEDWDSLRERATTYSASGWLRVRQEELPETGAAHLLLARDEAGAAVTGLELYAFTEPPHRLYAPSFLMSGLLDAPELEQLDRGTAAVGAGWSEFRGQVPQRPGLPKESRTAAVRAMTAEALSWARERDAHVLSYLYLPLEEALELAEAHAEQEPVLVFQDVENLLSTSWDSFEDYLAWLPRNRRTRVRRELRDYAEGGRTVRTTGLAEVVDRIAPLSNALMQKYGHDWYSEERARAVYGRQARYLEPASSVLESRTADGDLAGFALRYRRNDDMYSRVVGFDYSLPNHGDYFTLLMYEPIRTGPELGVRQINLGVGTYEAKLGRGALPHPLYAVFVGVEKPLPVEKNVLEEHNRRKIAEFEEPFGKFVVGGLDTGPWLPPRFE